MNNAETKQIAKHTPGPWTIVRSTKKFPISEGMEIWAGSTQVTDLYWQAHEGPLYPFENAEANARLIAAAPELLEALKNLLWQHDNNAGQLCGMALQDARAAIAKAEGVQQ